MISWLLNDNTECSCVQETKTKVIYPLSLCKVKQHLRIDNDFHDDDDYLETLIKVATTIAENHIEKDIAKTLTELRIEDFSGDCMKIYDGNFLNVVSVSDNELSAIGTIDKTTKKENYFKIEWASNIDSDPLYINYYTGFNEDETPELIQHAILIKIADLYDSQRADVQWSGLTNQRVFESILDTYRIIRF